MKTDPTTWLEAARQLREEAGLSCVAISEEADKTMTSVLLSMARRFENEAKAADGESAIDQALKLHLFWLDAEAAFFIRNPQVHSTYMECASRLRKALAKAAEEAKGETCSS